MGYCYFYKKLNDMEVTVLISKLKCGSLTALQLKLFTCQPKHNLQQSFLCLEILYENSFLRRIPCNRTFKLICACFLPKFRSHGFYFVPNTDAFLIFLKDSQMCLVAKRRYIFSF